VAGHFFAVWSGAALQGEAEYGTALFHGPAGLGEARQGEARYFFAAWPGGARQCKAWPGTFSRQGKSNSEEATKMKSFNCKWHGVSPLLLHSNAGVNPLHPLTREKKAVTSKRKKTEDDTLRILDLDYLLGLYWDDSTGVYVPAVNVEATIRDAAKKNKKGKDVVCGVMVAPEYIKLKYEGPQTREGLLADMNFRDIRIGKIQRASVTVCRPRFNNWEIDFSVEYDPEIWDKDALLETMVLGGKYIGLCDYRPRYGKFEVFAD